MALTVSNTLDVADGIQTTTFYSGATLIDQIEYSSNAITFSSVSSFNLVQSDLVLYGQYLSAFFVLLTQNFPVVFQSQFLAWPNCEFNITISTLGVEHIDYIQQSQGNSVYSINYVPVASSASFTSRSSVTISLQEFFMTTNMFKQYMNQVTASVS